MKSNSVVCADCKRVIIWQDKRLNDPRVVNGKLLCNVCADIAENDKVEEHEKNVKNKRK